MTREAHASHHELLRRLTKPSVEAWHSLWPLDADQRREMTAMLVSYAEMLLDHHLSKLTDVGLPHPQQEKSFQARVNPWLLECFGLKIAEDRIERNHRFLEEALELVQTTGCTRSEAHQLVEYVFDRRAGDCYQEAGGVMVTLAALCLAIGIDMHGAGETELTRVWGCVEKIRAKQAAKPKHSPLPADVLLRGEGERQVAAIQHTHRWRYNALVNAMFCRCGDRIECDHRLPAAIDAGYHLTEKPVDAAGGCRHPRRRAFEPESSFGDGSDYQSKCADCGAVLRMGPT